MKDSSIQFYVTHTFQILQSTYQSTNALNKIRFTTSMKLLRVVALGHHPQGVF